MFHLPFAAMTDCARSGDGRGGTSEARTAAGCLAACHAAERCASWQFGPGEKCLLNSNVPLTHHLVTRRDQIEAGFCAEERAGPAKV